jgi:type IV pilus assembly protein PilN
MTSINLLPWREEKREKKKRLFFIGIAIRGVSSLIIVIAIYIVLNNMISHQEARNQLIQTEISRYERNIREIKRLKIVRASLITRMNIIQQLQENRPEIVHFFDELTKIIPKSIYLVSIIRTNDSIMLVGHSDTNSSVSALMHSIRKNFWVNQPVLEEVEEVTDKKNKKLYNQFRVKLRLIPQNKRKTGLFTL